MGLLELLGVKKKNTDIGIAFVPDDDLEHLTPDGDLPWGWHTANKEFTEKIQSEYSYFLESWLASAKAGIVKEYAALKSLVTYMEDVKRLCDSKGECFAKWASDVIADQTALENKKKRLQQIEENIDALLAAEKRKSHIEANILPTLRADLLAAIKIEPGILQSEVYALFDSDLKEYIQQELYSMEKDGVIERQKSGRSYALFLKQA